MIVAKVQEWIQSLQSTTTGTGPSNNREEVLPLLNSFVPVAAPTGNPAQIAAKAGANPSFTVPVDSIVTPSVAKPVAVPIQAPNLVPAQLPVAAPAQIPTPASARVPAPAQTPAK
jgi:hypothetical protein